VEIYVSDQAIPTDKDGYLLNLHDWSIVAAEKIAQQEGITLSPQHWEIIHLIRDFYSAFELSPAMRALVKYANAKLGQDKGNSIYLLKLFPGSPPKLAAKIAGLPRPANCL
jgi:tRNA 2-thiouridine synthesizing protein E